MRVDLGANMETTWPVLTVLTFLPLIGVVFLLLIRGDEEVVVRNSRNVALWVSSFTFLISRNGKRKVSRANLVKAVKDEQAHWVDDFLFNDVDQPTAAMPYLALTDEFLNVIFI